RDVVVTGGSSLVADSWVVASAHGNSAQAASFRIDRGCELRTSDASVANGTFEIRTDYYGGIAVAAGATLEHAAGPAMSLAAMRNPNGPGVSIAGTVRCVNGSLELVAHRTNVEIQDGATVEAGNGTL